MPEKVWKPHKRQEMFASVPDSVFEALYGGAAGGGKSELLLMLPIIRGFHQEPRFKGILLRRTFPELEKEIIVRSWDWFPLAGAKYNEEKKRWTFPSGAIIQFGHAEYESDIRKYDTTEYNYMAFDELTSFTETQYIYLSMTRCRSSSSRLPAIVRSATNPGNIGHQWVRARFVEPAPYGTLLLDSKTKEKRIFIQAFAEDNPHLMQNDPRYVNRLEALNEAEKRAKKYGAWDSFEGQVFSEYREIPGEGEPESAQHVIDPIRIPDWWLRFLAIDWGFSAMTIALWGALSPDDRLYIYREYAIKEAKISTWATEIGNRSVGEQLSDVVLCRSAWQERGHELKIHEEFTKYSGLIPSQSDSDRIAGKLMVQEYLRWKERPRKQKVEQSFPYSHDTAAHILRNRGSEAYKSYLNSFGEEKLIEKLPKLQIFPDCKELRKCLPLCIYEKKANVTGKPAEDVREFDGDDPYDCLRYLVMRVDRYVGSQKDKNAQRARVNTILEQFQRDGNYFEMYRKMERVERIRTDPVPVARFHRVRHG